MSITAINSEIKPQSKVLMRSRDYKKQGRNINNFMSTLHQQDIKLIAQKDVDSHICKYPRCNNFASYFFNLFCNTHSSVKFENYVPLDVLYHDKILMIKGCPTILHNKRFDMVLIKRSTVFVFKFYTCDLNENLYSLHSSDYGESVCCKNYHFHRSNFFQVELLSNFDYHKLDNFTMQRLNENIECLEDNRPESNCKNCIYIKNKLFEDNSGNVFTNFYRCSLHTLNYDIRYPNLEIFKLNLPFLIDLNFCIICGFTKPNINCRFCRKDLKIITPNYRNINIFENTDVKLSKEEVNSNVYSEANSAESGIDFNNVNDLTYEDIDDKSIKNVQNISLDLNFKSKNPFEILKDFGKDLNKTSDAAEDQVVLNNIDDKFEVFSEDLKNKLNSMVVVKKLVKGDGYCGFRSLIGAMSEFKSFEPSCLEEILKKLSKISGSSDWFTALSLYEVALEYGFNLIIIHEDLTKYARFNVSDEVSLLPKIVVTSDFNGDIGTHFNCITRNYAYQDNIVINYFDNNYKITLTKDWGESDNDLSDHETSSFKGEEKEEKILNQNINDIEDNEDKETNDNNEDNEINYDKDDKSEEEISEDDDDDEICDDVNLDDVKITEVEEESNCCIVPKYISQRGYTQMTDLLKQFDNKNPEYLCLFNLLKISKEFLMNLNNSTMMPKESIPFLREYLKFRHNIFAFIFTNEVIKIPDSFNSEKPFKYIESNRTPDLVIYASNDTGKKVEIYEFTVVMNALRANFLKGIDKKTSKYKQEIIEFERLGFQVMYKPIFFSLSSTIDENIKLWESNGFDCSNSYIHKLFKDYIECFDFTYNYLFSLTFDKFEERKFEKSEAFLDLMNKHETGWNIKLVKSNKSILYKFLKVLKEYDFDDIENYLIRVTRLKIVKISLSIRKNQPNTIKGSILNDLKNDEYLLFKKFEMFLTGFDKCYLYTKSYIDDSSNFKPDHGKKIDVNNLDSDVFVRNKKNFCTYTIEQSIACNNTLLKTKMNGLNKKLDIEDIKKSLTVYSNKLDKFLKPDNLSNPPIKDDPRRSFLALIQSENILDINYKEGIKLTNFSILDVKSLFVKSISHRFKHIKYEKSIIVENNDLKENYKQSMSELFSFINSRKFQNKKIRTIKNELKSEELKLFIYLYDNYKKIQTSYIKYHDNVSKGGTLNLSRDEQNLLKSEIDWTSNQGYKLYMGEKKDLLGLFDTMKISTKNIKFNFNVPENIFDSEFFISMKNKSLEELKVNLSEIIKTTLFQNCVFLSRLCYTLLSLSNRTFNHKRVAIDNLGLSNVILIVKGGKKLTTTRKTKIFKLIYPSQSELQNWNKDVYSSDTTFIDETPWMQLNQNVLLDYISSPYKLLANYTYLREKYNENISLEMVMMPSLLLFHNRRKTEIMLHSMRYLVVNPLSLCSQVGKMLEEFAGPCYSPFDHAIKVGLKHHYYDYVVSIRDWSNNETNEDSIFIRSNIAHPYINRQLNCIEDLTYVIYSTYMMSRGHYEQGLEQTINLESIMETHEEYMKSNKPHSYDIFNKDAVKSLINDDFGYSPIVSYQVGKFLSSELKSKHSTNTISVGWNKILNTPIDDMANNRGLRYKGKDFFGHKGYYVVYKEIFDNNYEKLIDVLDSDLDEQKLHKKLKELNETFLIAQENKDLEKVIFHVVDKSQRGGHREIYVMDYDTKLYQNPIEKMFKLICEFIDNEIISIPAAKRTNLIHRKCFEFRSEKYETYYMSYDCRKWAPRSNTDKYLYLLLGMQDILPDDFLKSVINYFLHHKNKEIHTRTHIVDRFLKKEINKLKYEKYFQSDEESGSSWFNMPYSFVMGIFNMLSSLMHAGGQIYFKYLLEKEILEKAIIIDFDMYAHSDDSGGRLSIEKGKITEDEVIDLIGKYEYLQKTINHLMSTKKCNTSKSYFELLSILYINHQLLPVLPKFLGNISLTFTGQGISSDFKQIISKSIELQMNGATSSQSYKCQMILSNMYRNFYRIDVETQLPSLGGTPNSWPTLYMVYGSAVDEMRLAIYNNNFYKKLMTFCIKNLEFEVQDGTVNLKFKNVLRMPRAYHMFKKKINLPEFEDSQWFFEQNKTRHSVLNLYWFRAKLESSNFALSILNINDIRRAYDSLYMSTGDHILGKLKEYNINDLILEILQTEGVQTNHEIVLNTMYRELKNFYLWTDTIPKISFSERLSISMKPCSLSLVNFVEAPITEYNSLHLATQICRPELMKYTYSNKRYGLELNSMTQYLLSLGVPNDIVSIKNFLDYMSKTRNQVNYFYSEVTSKNRHLHNQGGLYDVILNNFHNKLSINTGSYKFIENIKTEVSLNKQIVNYIMCYYLYILFKQSRDDDLAATIIDKSITNGKTVYLNNVPNLINREIKEPGIIPFLRLIESQEPVKINLWNLTNWCLWTDRQGKLGQDWVGKGKLEISLDNNIFEIHVINKDITRISHRFKEPHLFSDISTQYFYKLVKQFDLNFTKPLTIEESKIYFGLDHENRLGFFGGNNIKIGVQQTDFQQNYDNTRFDHLLEHTYLNGKHFINIKNINYHLYTIDEIAFNENKSNLFDIIDWSNINNKTKNRFMQSLFSGNYGSIDFIKYEKEDLLDNFLATDLYRLYYQKKTTGKNLNEAIWEDILTNFTHNEDIFPTLFENMGLQELEKILPKTKKDNLAMFLFYDTENDDLMYLRSKLNLIENEKERIEFITKIITQLNDNTGIVNLPEIGDPIEFKKYSYNGDLLSYNWITSIDILSQALYNGYIGLSITSISKFHKIYENKIQDESSIKDLFFGMMMKKDEKNSVYLKNFSALSVNQMSVHLLLELIFSEKNAFSEFARTFRGTIMKNVPRHPRYENEWQYIISNSYKFCYNKTLGDNKSLMDSRLIRKYALPERITFNNDVSLNKYQLTNENINSTVIPPLLKIFYSTNELEDLDFSIIDVDKNDLDIFQFDEKELKNQVINFDEFIEDSCEEEIIRKRKQKSHKIEAFLDMDNLCNFSNNCESNNNRAIATIFFDPNIKCQQMIATDRHNNVTKLFIYNYNDEVKLHSQIKQVNYKKLWNKYINFYKEEQVYSYHIFEDKINKITVDVKNPPNIEVLKVKYEIDSNKSYNNDLLEYLIEEFSIEDEKIIEMLKDIFNSNLTATTKFLKTKQIINNYNKTKAQNINIDELIKKSFLNMNEGPKINLKINMKGSLLRTERSPSKMIENTTSYKKEFKQAETITDNFFGKIITENLKLNEKIKKHLSLNFKMILHQLKKNRKLKNEIAQSRVIIDIIESTTVGDMSSDSYKFDDFCRDFISRLTLKLIDEEDDEDILDPPETKIDDWRLVVNR